MSSPSAFERRQGIQGPTGPTGPSGPAGPSGPTGPPSPAITLSGNTTGTLTLISTGTVTLAGGNNITLSQSGNRITISAGASGGGGFSAGMSTEGNTAGNTGVTGSRVVLVGSGPISLSQTTGAAGGTVSILGPATSSLSATGAVSLSTNGSTISIGAPTQTNQAGSVYASSNTFGTSSGTYDARSISIAGRGAVSVAASNSGWIVSAPVQTAETAISGIANSQTTYTSGTVSLSELGAVTIRSTTGNQFQISVNAQSVQPETQTFIAGISASDTLYTSGNVRLTGVGGGITVSSNTGQRIDLSVAAPVAQTVQTQNVVDVTLSGNTAGAMALVSSGTLTLAGGNNITLSQAGNAVTISGGAGGAFSAGMSTEGNTAGNTGVTGSRLVFVGSNNISLSQTTGAAGATLSFNGPASSSLSATGAVSISANGSTISIGAPAQTNQAGSVYAISNTSGTSSGTYDARTLSIAGAGLITVAASNSGWRIDATSAAQTNQAGSVYASSNTFGTSSGTYDARSISIAGRGEISVAASNSGWIISAPAQTEQTQSRFNLTLSGNSTSGGAGYIQISSGVMTLAGGNNVTLSQAGNAVTISGPNVAGAQTGISSIVASDATYTSGAVTFSGVGGGATVNSNTGQRVDISVAAPVAQTNQAGSVYASSNTFGTSSGTYDARSLSIAGSGNVSVAASNSGWVISVPASAAQTNQAGSVYAISNTSGTSSGTYDARTLSIAGAGIVTVAASNSGWRISASQSLQTSNVHNVTLAGNSTSAGAGYIEVSSGTLTLAGGANITLSQNGNAVSILGGAGAFSAGMSTEGNTAGATGVTGSRLVLVGSNNISLSQTTGAAGGTVTFNGPASSSLSATGAVSISANGSTISIGAPAQTTQTQGILSAGVSTGGNTLGNTTVNTGSRLVLVGSGMVTASQATAAGASTITLNATQSVQTQNIMNVTLSGNSTSAGGGYVLISTGTMVLAGGNNITLSQNANSVTISAGAGGAATAISGLANSQTTYTSGTVSLSELGAITIRSTTGNQFQLSVNAQTNQAGNVYASSNTTGTSSGTYDARSISIAGAGGVSVAASNSGWVVSAPATSSLSATGLVSLSTNASTISVGVASTSFAGTGDVSVSLNGSTLSIGVPSPDMSYRWVEGPLQMGVTQGIGASNANGTQTTVTAWVQPVSIPADMAFNNVYLAVQNSFSSATTSISSVRYSYSMGASLGFYSLNANTMSLVTSFSNTLGYTNQTAAAVGNMSFTASMGYGGSGTSKTTQGGANLSAIMGSIQGIKQIPLNWTSVSNTLTRGQYWAVVAFSQLTGSVANASLTSVGFVSNYSAIGTALNPPPIFGDSLSVTSPYPFMGLATLINDTNSRLPSAFSTSKITTATAIANSTNFQSIWMNLYSSHGT